MINKHIHIVSFDIPHPPDYGGVIDVFYKIKALNDNGFNVHLHCFEYGREQAQELEKHCASVHYIKRKTGFLSLLHIRPYIVWSRRSKELLDSLCADDYPVIFEGLHCCNYLLNKKLASKKRIVRTHNIEHEYYKHLALSEKNYFKKIFFISESLKLKWFEKKLKFADAIASISKTDNEHFAKYSKSHLVPAFTPEYNILQHKGLSKNIVYHGNLAVNENIKASLHLINNVFSKIDFPCVIAGKNPSQEIIDAVKPHKNIKLIANPANDELVEIIKDAQINILITFQATGVKLKLLNALRLGRHCIVNSKMTSGTGLETLCHTANTPQEIIEKINSLYFQPYNQNNIDYKNRMKIFSKSFSNNAGVKILEEIIFNQNH